MVLLECRIHARDVIEAAANQPLARVVSDLICKPLCLSSVELAETGDAFSKLHWSAAENYDPRWVYHGCLTGTVPDAARLLHALFQGALLKPETLRQMLARRPLGGAIPGRPWIEHGYALGLMSGEVAGQGRAIGHSGVGPFFVNAVYHFPDMPAPVTVACFTDGTDEGVAEWRCAELAKAQ
jgi:CubicO group peptidase (beta-lactamase class C family)